MFFFSGVRCRYTHRFVTNFFELYAFVNFYSLVLGKLKRNRFFKSAVVE